MRILILILFLIIPPTLHAEDFVFIGKPKIKTQVMGGDTKTDKLSKEDSEEFKVIIVQSDNNYYWASRDMKKLIKSVSGAYVTYHAVDGSGYVKLIPKNLAPLLVDEDNPYTYVEHLSYYLASISYHGN